jgi:cytochrome c5
MRLVIVALLTGFSFLLYAVDDIDQQQIQQRIQPVGKVHVQEEPDDSSNDKAGDNSAANIVSKEPGQETYEQYCIVCHRDGLAGAPKFRDAGDWNPRLAGKTINDLVNIAISGLNAMPAKGTCVECNDAELKDAIQYMLPKS